MSHLSAPTYPLGERALAITTHTYSTQFDNTLSQRNQFDDVAEGLKTICMCSLLFCIIGFQSKTFSEPWWGWGKTGSVARILTSVLLTFRTEIRFPPKSAPQHY